MYEKYITIGGIQIGSEGAMSFAPAIQQLKSLTTLDISIYIISYYLWAAMILEVKEL